MKNTKVVVMSAQDVAELRRQKKETENAYRNAKIAAFEFIVDEMKHTGKEYTAAELASVSGLSSEEISTNIHHFICGNESYNHGVDWIKCAENIRANVAKRETWAKEHFARILPDGTIDSDNKLIITRRKVVYFAR